MPGDVERLLNEIKRELSEYHIAEEDLDRVFDPLLASCSKVAKNDKELKQCVLEGINTLKSILSRVR